MTPRRLGALLAVLWAVAAWQVSLIPESMIQMTVGARATPAAVVAFLGAVVLGYTVSALRGRQVDLLAGEGAAPEQGATARVAWLLGGGALFILLVQPLGFVLPAALSALSVARAFDAPLSWRSVMLSLTLAGAFWGLLAGLLGVGLGPALPGLA